jgi:hypothetical protein
MLVVYIILILIIVAFLIYFAYAFSRINKHTYDIAQPLDVTSIPIFGQRDAFGREKVAIPHTLGDYTHIYGINPDFFDITSGGGSIQYLQHQAASELKIDDGLSGEAIHQTKRYHHYMPGKSQFILSSFVFGESNSGTSKSTGYFDNRNGIFFHQNEQGDLSFILRSYTTGTAEERIIERANWNGDKADGSGKTGFNLDITKTQLLFIDFQWLGVGKVNCGFINKNDYILCHTFYNSNILDKVFMSSGNLPLRCQIARDQALAGGVSMTQICSTVISEGGYVEAGRDWSIGTSVANSISNNNETGILAIKLKDSFGTYNDPNHMTIRLGNANTLSSGEDIIYYIKKVSYGSSLAATWTDINEESGAQFTTSFSIPTDNIFTLETGYAAGNSQGNKNFANSGGNLPPVSAKQNYIVQNFNSDDSEAYILTAKRLDGSGTANVSASMQWREIY